MNGVNSKVSRESVRPTDLKGVMEKEVDISDSPTVQNAAPFGLMIGLFQHRRAPTVDVYNVDEPQVGENHPPKRLF